MRFALNALSVLPGETGGGETYLTQLVRAMEDAPHEVIVHCTERNAVLVRDAGSVRVVKHAFDNRSRARRLFFEHLRLATHVARDRCDALFSPGNALPLRTGAPAVLGIQSLHSFVVPQEMARLRVAYFRRAVPWSARRAVRVICVSEDLRRTLLASVPGLDTSKVRVVQEGAPDDMRRTSDAAAVAALCASLGVEPGRHLLYVSSLNPFKRPESAIAAVAALRRSRAEDWPLVLAGRGNDEQTARVLAAADREGVRDLVRIAGVRSREDLAILYSAARALVYPSVVETWGLPPLEAMACECPVVAADRTSIPEVCGDAALLADPDDRTAFADAVARVVHDEGLRSALVERGSRRVKELSWGRAARGTLAVLEEAASAAVPR